MPTVLHLRPEQLGALGPTPSPRSARCNCFPATDPPILDVRSSLSGACCDRSVFRGQVDRGCCSQAGPFCHQFPCMSSRVTLPRVPRSAGFCSPGTAARGSMTPTLHCISFPRSSISPTQLALKGRRTPPVFLVSAMEHSESVRMFKWAGL